MAATAFAITATDADKPEGNAGTTVFTFTITRAGDTTAASTIDWSVAGTGLFPAIPSDFVGGLLPSGTVFFDIGVKSVIIEVPVQGDTLPGPDETFAVTISNPLLGEDIVVPTADGIIRDDDAGVFFGTTRNDTIYLAPVSEGAVLDVSQGGNDTIYGSDGPDTVIFGAAFTNYDRVIGGAGFDAVAIQGDYSAGITLKTNTFVSVEDLIFGPGYNYKLTTVDPTIAPGGTLQLDASSLAAINSVNINGAAETNGHFVFLGGAGNDTFKGGRIDDLIYGGGGADKLDGYNGRDTFGYDLASDSGLQTDQFGNIQTSAADTLQNFQRTLDKIDLSLFGLDGTVVTRSTNGFTGNVSSGTGFFAAGDVVTEYGTVGRTLTTRVYVDANLSGNLDKGDMMIQLTGVGRGSLGADSFIF